MDAELKSQWIGALRSDLYSQTTDGYIFTHDGKMCALGVLMMLFDPTSPTRSDRSFRYPSTVGLLTTDQEGEIWQQNDVYHFSFRDIANYIEKFIS